MTKLTGAMYGFDSIGPMIGILLRNVIITAKKSPKSCSMPMASTMNPTNDHFIKMRTIPSTKKIVPRIFVDRVKNTTVFCGPMISTTPMTNNNW